MVYNPQYDLRPPPAPASTSFPPTATTDPFADLRAPASAPSPVSSDNDPFADLRAIPPDKATLPAASTAGVTSEPQAQQPLSWSDVPGQALSNIPSSAGQNIKAMAQPFIHPVETVENLGSLGIGGLQKAGLAPGTSFEPYADALVDFYKNRYGSVEGLKHTLANDPVGVLSDLSTFFAPGEAAARLPGIVGNVGEAVAKVSRATNPVNIAAKAVPAIGRATGLIGDADRVAANAALADAGVLRTPGQRIGGAFKTLEDAASSIPILGSFISGGRKTSVESFNQAVANQALEPIGQATKAKAGHALVQDVEDKLGNAYDQLLPNLRFSPDGDFVRDLANIRTGVKSTLTGDRANQFDSIVQSRLPAASQGTMYTGEEFKNIESQIKTIANQYRSSADGDQRMLGQSLDKVIDAMKAGLERNNPAFADQLSKINYGWAMYARMRAAASRRATSEGVFTPNDLLNAVKGADKSVGKGTFAKGDALMQTFAEAGQKVLPSELPTSGTVERGLHAGALLGGAHLMASPHLLAAGAAAAVPYTKLGMKATDIASRLPYGTAARTALPAGRLGEAAAGQYGFAKGGAVRSLSTKAQANYRAGTSRHHCAICTMFVKPSSCTAVRGHISPRALCDFYEPKGKGERIVDNKYDVVTGANSSKKPTGPIFIDRHIPEWSPKLRTKDGKRVRLWTYLSLHEDEEQKRMEKGETYDAAHEGATLAEKNKAEADGVNWKAYTAEINGYLDRIEHEKVTRKPPVPLHVKPEAALKGGGHHHSSHKNRHRQGGGRVEDEPPSGDPISPGIGHAPVLQIGVGPGFVGSSAPGAAPLEGTVISPSSPNVAKAITRANAWMQERAQREPQPALQRNIQMMLRGGPMAEAIAKHTLRTFQPHPSEMLPSGGVIDMGDE